MMRRIGAVCRRTSSLAQSNCSPAPVRSDDAGALRTPAPQLGFFVIDRARCLPVADRMRHATLARRNQPGLSLPHSLRLSI
jgi:hypothetical protein